MYNIETNEKNLVVSFLSDFDYSVLKQIIYSELMMPEFSQLNDLWIVGTHRSQIRLGEIQTIVDEFSRLCPPETITKKLAIVAEPGLTSAILELLADGFDKNLPLSCRIFSSMDAAAKWVDSTKQCVS